MAAAEGAARSVQCAAMSDPYAVLGVSSSASAEQITETYRALAQIYHPDRYATAPPRVRAEAEKRMQALNAAYDVVRRSEPGNAGQAQRPRPQRRAEQPAEPVSREPEQPVVLYVDGTRRHHGDHVLPLGFGVEGEQIKRIATAVQCGSLNAELLQWFRLQRASATMSDKLMFEAWDAEQRAIYTATFGCARVPLTKVGAFATACTECQPTGGAAG